MQLRGVSANDSIIFSGTERHPVKLNTDFYNSKKNVEIILFKKNIFIHITYNVKNFVTKFDMGLRDWSVILETEI